MEAFALLQIEKKNKRLKQAEELEKQKILARTIQPHTRPLSPSESKQLNRSLGQCIPPDGVYAIGRDSSAAVWWTRSPDDDMCTAWEVHRYRKDLQEWNYKGCIRIEVIDMGAALNQTIITNLNNDKEYRFSVKGCNDQGPSAESSMSNPVMVEKPLPSGWYRFYCDIHHKFYYANIRLQRSSWTRPEMDPLYLEESVLMNFRDHEIKHLYSLYSEEMEHFRSVQLERMPDVFSECGEIVGIRRLRQLFLAYATESETKLVTWREFMDVITHVKRDLTQPSTVAAGVMGAPTALLNSIGQGYIADLLGGGRQKLGEWELVPCPLLGQRKYYHNLTTGERQWDMPDAVRFYIPDKLLRQLLVVFDYGHLENFRYQFSMIDVDHSGDITEVELKLLLKSMGLVVEDSLVRKLVRTIDLNGNGTVEFNEFCYMMYCLRNRHLGERTAEPGVNASIWRELDISGVKSDAAHLKSKHEMQQQSLQPQTTTTTTAGDGGGGGDRGVVRRGQLGADDMDDDNSGLYGGHGHNNNHNSNNGNSSPRSVQSMQSRASAAMSVSESLRGIKNAVFNVGGSSSSSCTTTNNNINNINNGGIDGNAVGGVVLLPAVYGDGDSSPTREFSPATGADGGADTTEAQRRDLGRILFAMSEGHFVASREVQLAEHLVPVEDLAPSRGRSSCASSDYGGDDCNNRGGSLGGSSLSGGLGLSISRSTSRSPTRTPNRSRANSQSGAGVRMVRPLAVARTNSMTWGDQVDGQEEEISYDGLVLNTTNLGRLGEIQQPPPPGGGISGPGGPGGGGDGSSVHSNSLYSQGQQGQRQGQRQARVQQQSSSQPASQDNSYMEYSSSPVGKPHQQPEWVKLAAAAQNSSQPTTPFNNSSNINLCSPKGRLHRALSWVDEVSSPNNNSNSNSNDLTSPSIKALKAVRGASSRVSSAALDLSRTAKKVVGSAVKVFTAQTVELQRTLAIAAGVERPEGYIDQTTGEVHTGYCFCGCRRR